MQERQWVFKVWWNSNKLYFNPVTISWQEFTYLALYASFQFLLCVVGLRLEPFGFSNCAETNVTWVKEAGQYFLFLFISKTIHCTCHSLSSKCPVMFNYPIMYVYPRSQAQKDNSLSSSDGDMTDDVMGKSLVGFSVTAIIMKLIENSVVSMLYM